jgi:hypothetical protein
VSCRVESKLRDGYVEVKVTPPPRRVEKLLLRAPLPDGWRTASVEIDGDQAALGEANTVDLSGRNRSLTVRYSATQ